MGIGLYRAMAAGEPDPEGQTPVPPRSPVWFLPKPIAPGAAMRVPSSIKQADTRATPRGVSSRAIQERAGSGFFAAGLVAAQTVGLINELVWVAAEGAWEKQLGVLLAAGHRVITDDRRAFAKSSCAIGSWGGGCPSLAP